jgi:hypothetical protein
MAQATRAKAAHMRSLIGVRCEFDDESAVLLSGDATE